MEEWVKVPYNNIYSVNKNGDVRNNETGRMLKPNKDKDGYLRVELHKDKKRKHYYVHRLVWEAFNGPIPEGMQVNHISERPWDNRLENLNLLTPKENSNWGTRNKRVGGPDCIRKREWVVQFDLYGDFVAIYKSTKEAEGKTNVNSGNISSCCNGRIQTAGGYVWRYIKNPEE